MDARAVKELLARAPDRLDTAIRGSLNDGATYFLAKMKLYPAQRPGSRYIRTKTLDRSWSMRPIVRTSHGWQVIVGSNGNIAPYNRVVQSRADQARIHRGRWITAETTVEQSASQVQRFVDARIRAAMAGA